LFGLGQVNPRLGLKSRSIEPVIPGKSNRKRRLRFHSQAHKLRHRIEKAALDRPLPW